VHTNISASGRVFTRGRFLAVNGTLLVVLIVTIVAGCVLGPGGFDLSKIFPLDPSTNPEAALLVLARLPRVLLAALVGATLATVGAAFQALLRNPLADPLIMGVSGGAALGGTLALVLFGSGASAQLALEGPAAFVGGVIATILVQRVGTVSGRLEPTTILLVGVVFNTFAAAVIMFLKTVVSAQKTQEILFWLMGSLGYRDYSTVAVVAVGSAVGLTLIMRNASALNALALGEYGAAHLGVNVERTRWIVLIASSLLVGLAVSVSGLVGFVGLIVPHLFRLGLGPDHRLLLPATALGGASFLVLADLGARLLFIPLATEPPVGVVTAFLGGPFFLLLLRKRSRMAFPLT
jgi:iron complex transport system permease protein